MGPGLREPCQKVCGVRRAARRTQPLPASQIRASCTSSTARSRVKRSAMSGQPRNAMAMRRSLTKPSQSALAGMASSSADSELQYQQQHTSNGHGIARARRPPDADPGKGQPAARDERPRVFAGRGERSCFVVRTLASRGISVFAAAGGLRPKIAEEFQHSQPEAAAESTQN